MLRRGYWLAPLPLVFLCLGGWVWAGALVAGRVFVDVNKNGAFDVVDRPLANVLVSAWDKTGVTNANGSYALALGQGTHIVHASWRSGLWPSRTPFWREVVLEAGGRKTADFPFSECIEKFPFYVVQMSDIHASRPAIPRMRKVCEFINNLKPQAHFVINTGDLTVAGSARSDAQAEERWRACYVPCVGALRRPLFHAIGNHDYGGIDIGAWAGEGRRFVGRGGYRHFCGPLNYAFAHGGWHFIVIEGATPRLPPEKFVQLSVPEQTLRWLEAYLSHAPRNEPKILFSHYDPSDVRGNAKKLRAIVQGRGLRRIYVGHDRREGRFEFARAQGVRTAAVSGSRWSGHGPAWDAQGFRIVRLDRGGSVHSAYLCPWRENHIQIDAPSPPGPLRGTVEVKATVFDPKDIVHGATVSLGRVREVAMVTNRGPWKEITGMLSTPTLPDGTHQLWVIVRPLEGVPLARVVVATVANSPPKPFEPVGEARLRLRVRGVEAEATVLVNGQKVGLIPPATEDDSEVTFDVSAKVLAQMGTTDREGKLTLKPNMWPVAAVSFRPGKKKTPKGEEPDVFEVADILLDYADRFRRDVRTTGGHYVEIREVGHPEPKPYRARIQLGGHRHFEPDSRRADKPKDGVHLRVRTEPKSRAILSLHVRYGAISSTRSTLGLTLFEDDKPITHIQVERPDGAFTWRHIHLPWGIERPTYRAELTTLEGDIVRSKKVIPPPR